MFRHCLSTFGFWVVDAGLKCFWRCRRLALAVLLSIALPCLAGAASFRFAWLSDTHVGSSSGEEDLRAAVNDLNGQAGLSFVIVSGDVTEYGSLEQLQLAKRVLDGLKMPCYVVPGNHDAKWSESGATDFGRLWKADRFVFDWGGYRFIGMYQGPVMKMGDGHWAPQDVRWLQATLDHLRTGDQPVIFVTHYPIDDSIANWYVVLDLLKKHNTQVVLCGHGHANREFIFEGVPGVMGRSSLRASHPAGGYNLVEVKDGRMTCSERIPGVETRAPWHSVLLEKHNYAADTNSYPRPDFSVNSRYPGVKEQWALNTGYTIAGSPGLWRNCAIIGDASGTVRELEVETGQARWNFKARNAVYATPAVAQDLVVVPCTDGDVYALEAGTGKQAWRFKTSRPILA